MFSLSIFTLSANVPVIDVSSLRRGFESDAARRCIAEIGTACTDVGFFYVSNHGISEYLQMALARARWDDRDPTDFEGRYGEYLLRKVRKVFPHLASRDAIDAAMREWDRSKS